MFLYIILYRTCIFIFFYLFFISIAFWRWFFFYDLSVWNHDRPLLLIINTSMARINKIFMAIHHDKPSNVLKGINEFWISIFVWLLRLIITLNCTVNNKQNDRICSNTTECECSQSYYYQMDNEKLQAPQLFCNMICQLWISFITHYSPGKKDKNTSQIVPVI